MEAEADLEEALAAVVGAAVEEVIVEVSVEVSEGGDLYENREGFSPDMLMAFRLQLLGKIRTAQDLLVRVEI